MALIKFSIAIIESLPSGETKTGENLYSSTIKYKGFQNPEIHSELIQVESKDELLVNLERLSEKAISENIYYFLHFEMHGFIGGIQTANGDKVGWSELFPVFRAFNFHYKDRLMICLAVCEGGSLIASTKPELRSPFNLLVACANKMYESEIAEGFEAFYDEFCNSYKIDESIHAYNSKIAHDDNKLSSITSEYLFDMVTDINRFPDNKLKMVQGGIKKLKAINKAKPLSEFEYIKRSTLIAEIIFSDLKSKKDYFLMNDLQDK
jgi:hypothetical protein